MRRLIHGAEGMFRWVACQIDHLCELPNDRARSKALDNLPRGLPETYERILSRILDHHDEVQDLVSRTLAWLVCAKRDLEPLALLEAISLSPGDTSLELDALVSEDDILRWCSSLLRRRANGEGIELAHFTVKEYLLSIPSDRNAKFSKFNVQKDKGDLLIGRACLTYLNMDCLDRMPPCITLDRSCFEGIAVRVMDFPLLTYAANCWYEHVEKAMEDSLVFELSCKLFSVRKSYNFVWWTYAFLSKFLNEDWREPYWCDVTPLHWAALLRIPELCQWLISQGVDANHPSAFGSSLDCAIMGTILLNQFNEEELLELGDNTGDYDIDESLICTVTQLIQGGADLNQVSCSVPRYSSIGLALLTCPYDKLVLDLLLTSGALVTNSTLSLIEKYLHINLDLNLDLTMISISVILSDSSRLFVVDSAMSTFERLSAVYNSIVGDTKGNGIDRSFQPLEDIELVEDKFLFDAGNGICKDIFSSVLALRKDGSPESEKTLTRGLCLALEYNHQNVVELLLEKNVSTTLVDENGASPIHKILGEYPIRDVATTIRDIKNLIDHGADLTSRDKAGRLAIHLAAASQHVLLTKEVIQIMGPETIGKELANLVPSILECAVRDGSDENAIFALYLYHDINPTDHESEDGTPLMGLAASRESDIILRLLSRRGLSMDVIGKDGSSVLFQAARSIHEAPFNYLMDVKATDNSTRSDGRRAIHEAVTNDYDVSASKLSALLRAGEDPNIRCDDGSPLELTISDKVSRLNKLELLLSYEKIDVNARNDSGATILMEYLGWGYNSSRDSIGENNYILSSMKLLLSHEVDMNLHDSNGRTALHYLCSEDVTQTSFDLLKSFVNSGASLCTKNSTGVTAFELLFVRCFSRAMHRFDEDDRLKILEYIIDNALETLNNHLSCGMTPLVYVLDNRSFPVASLLLAKANLDVDIRDLSNWPATAVDRAAWRGCTKYLARDLLARTKIPIDSAPLEIGYSLLHLSSMNVNSSIFLQELLQKDVDLEVLSSQGYTPLQIAVRSGSLAAVESLIKAGGIFKAAVGNPPRFPLHLAARDGRLPIVRLLIEAGADPKACSLDSKSTILHYASTAGSWEFIQYLIDMGCTIDEKDIKGMTPYLNAASAKNWDLVQKYTTVGVNVHATNNLGFGALHFAILRGSLPTVRFLLEKYPSLQRNMVDREGKLTGSALTISLISGSIDLFNLFWKEGSDQFVSDHGDGIAHFAMRNGCPNSLRTILLTHEINWNLNTGYLHSVGKLPALRGLLPLHVAAAMPNDLAIKFLDNNKLFADINTLSTGPEGYAALHIAAYCNNRKTIQLLLELGAKIDIKSSSNGRRPLHIAAGDGFIEAVTELLNSSCDPNPLDDEGLTPELLAIENNQHEVAKVLGAHLDSLKVSQNSTGSDGSDGSDNDDNTLEKTNISGSWRIPLLWSPLMRNVLTEEVSIYAVKDSECPRELRNALAEGKDKGVYHLGRPQVRRI